jgi:hypothetical protein
VVATAPAVAPLVNPNYLAAQADRDDLAEGLRLVHRLFQAPPEGPRPAGRPSALAAGTTVLVRRLRAHIKRYGTTPDGRIF